MAVDGNADIRISVRPEDAEEAQRLIESHRTEGPGGRVIPLRKEFADLRSGSAISFRDAGLLEHALTHTSRANEDVSGGVIDNESLEFLGDAVLGFAIADLLFRRFPDRDEGWKSKMKAALVSTSSLARLAEGLNLGDHLLLGRGEEKTGGRRKQALLADGYEALDCGDLPGWRHRSRHGVHRAPVQRMPLIPLINDARAAAAAVFAISNRRCKSACSRPAIRRRNTSSSAETGPDHHKMFQVEVRVGGRRMAEGVGPEQEGSGAGSGAARAREAAFADQSRGRGDRI